MKLVDGDRALSAQFRVEEEGLDVARMVVAGVPAAPFQAAFSRVVRRQPVSFTNWNAVCPEPEQRNRAVSVVELLGWEGLRAPPVYVEAVAPHGLGDRDQLRALVCDGPSLLGWVGAFRPTPFTAREVRLFDSLVPALQQRLSMERQLEDAPAVLAMLGAALEAIPGAAYVIRGRSIAHANAMGRAVLDADPVVRRSELLAFVDGHRREGVSVMPIASRGSAEHVLVVDRRSRADTSAALRDAQLRWGLTPRQLEVLGELVRGEPNKTIAVTLGCSERTVEIHVTALLRKAGSSSRSELVARFWTGTGFGVV
ncbi:MAG: helix-turn-helix transcriptional regulator [Labilithrix sp.]|nr:helix-turn-helix transcriptional regulator [Labilithrix sp.]